MCLPDKYGRPSSFCMIPLALLCIILGGGLVGTWVGCYFECIRGKLIDYNYYAAVWTGGIAVFSGLFQLCLVCFWNKPLKYFLIILNVILILCCLLCGALYSYITYLENKDNEMIIGADSPSLGVILTGLQAVLAVFILFFVMIWNCVIGCASLDEQPEIYEEDLNSRRKTSRQNGSSQRTGVRGPYEDDFFNREPGIYQTQGQYQERPQEVSYGQRVQTNAGTASSYIIPRASVRGAVKENGYHSNGGTMVVDGRENNRSNRNEEPRGFYSGSSRYQNGDTRQYGDAHQSGGALQNGTGERNRDLGSRAGELTGNRYGHGVNLMQMQGVAPTFNPISDGYY